MGAPVGNEFWKLRTKFGRDQLFTTPDILWEAACEYFQWAHDNPLKEVDFKGKDAERVNIPRMRAFTIQGLCLYLGVNTKYFNDFRDRLREKTDENSKVYSEVVTRILETIYQQKFEGSAANLLNANIIARDLGLKDQSVTEVEDKRKAVSEAFPDVLNMGEQV